MARRYKAARGPGGFVRASWDEAVELAAAAHVHTIRTWGPDRIAGFSPIPAMSMVSHAAGARFHALIGAPLLSFCDWYADLPVASPQVFGDQTDVPESVKRCVPPASAEAIAMAATAAASRMTVDTRNAVL